MRRTLKFGLFALLLMPLAAMAQSTAVTLATSDPDGQSWNSGTYVVQYTPAAGSIGAPTNTSTNQLLTPLIYSGTLSNTGTLSLTLVPNNFIYPANSKWTFTICPAMTWATCSTVAITITGANQNVSAAINATLVAPRSTGGPGSIAYNDVEVAGLGGNQYFRLADSSFRCYTTSWTNCALGSGGSGTVTTFSSGNLTNLFATSVANPTSTPALTFTAANAAANTVFGNFTGSAAAPTFSATPVFSAATLTNFPTFNQNTTGTAGGLTGSPAITVASVTDSGLTSGNCVQASTGGLLTTIGAACGSGGGVTTFSAGTLSPLFTTSVTNPASTPALNFVISNAAANTVFGNFTGSSAAPTYSATPVFSAATLTNFPTFNQNTTGTSGGLTGSPAITVSNVTDSALTSGNCVQASTGGILTTTGAACGSGGGSGTVTSSTANQITYFAATGSTVIGDTRFTDNATTLAYTGSGGITGASFTGTGTANGSITLPYTGTAATAPGTSSFMISPNINITTPWSLSPAAAPATGFLFGTNSSAIEQQSFVTASSLYGTCSGCTAAVFTLTTTGTSGAATYNSGTATLNIPSYSGGTSYPDFADSGGALTAQNATAGAITTFGVGTTATGANGNSVFTIGNTTQAGTASAVSSQLIVVGVSTANNVFAVQTQYDTAFQINGDTSTQVNNALLNNNMYTPAAESDTSANGAFTASNTAALNVITLTGNSTMTLNAPSKGSQGGSAYSISVCQTGSNTFTFTWPANVADYASKVITVPGGFCFRYHLVYATTATAYDVDGFYTQNYYQSASLFTAAGAASAPGLKVTGAPYTAGTASTNWPQFYVDAGATEPTTFSTAGTMFGVNAPSAFSGNLLALYVNGTGEVTIPASGVISSNGLTANGTVNLNATGYVYKLNGDTGISRDSTGGAGFLDFGNGTANDVSGTATTKVFRATHFAGNGTAPTSAAGTGAGTSPTLALDGNAHDTAFTINLTTGTSPVASATLATITFNVTWSNAPHCSLSSNNAATSLAVAQVYKAQSTTALTLSVGTTALTASTAYSWDVLCTQ